MREILDLKELLEEEHVPFTKEEQAYRRGYCHGFLAAIRNDDLTWQDVYAWRNGNDETGPPGSVFSGIYMDGLRQNNKNEFFINTLEHKE